jgi:tetratricopeptide (TPR) repeat protein
MSISAKKLRKVSPPMRKPASRTYLLLVSALALAAAVTLYGGDAQKRAPVEAAPVRRPPADAIHGSVELNEALDKASRIKTAPGHPVPYHDDPKLSQAIDLIGQSRWLDAEGALLALLAERPSDPLVLNELATVEAAGKMRPDKAVTYLESMLRLAPDFPGVWTRYRDTVALAGGQKAAIELVQSLAEQDRYEVPLTIGLFYEDLQDHAAAIDYLQRASQHDGPHLGRTYQILAKAQQHAGRLSDAEAALKRAIDVIESHNAGLDPTLVKSRQDAFPASVALVELYFESKQYDQARRLLDELLELDRMNPILLTYAKTLEGIEQ